MWSWSGETQSPLPGDGAAAGTVIRRTTRTRRATRLLKLGLLGTIAQLTPPSTWRNVAHHIARPLGARQPDPDTPIYEFVLGERPALDDERRAWRREAQLLILGLAGWWPQSVIAETLEGGEHLERALAEGHGAVLWMSGFAAADLVSKVALWRRGFRLHQLSRPEHGFSGDPVDVAYFNKFWRAVEDRFLASRVVIEDGASAAALARLRALLSENQIIKITVGNLGRRVVDVPFLNGTLRLATGPIALARGAGAPLLPVHTVAEGSRGFRTVVEAPLPFEIDAVDPFKEAAVAYARGLETWVRSHPAEWIGWCDLVPYPSAAPQRASSRASAI